MACFHNRLTAFLAKVRNGPAIVKLNAGLSLGEIASVTKRASAPGPREGDHAVAASSPRHILNAMAG